MWWRCLHHLPKPLEMSCGFRFPFIQLDAAEKIEGGFFLFQSSTRTIVFILFWCVPFVPFLCEITITLWKEPIFLMGRFVSVGSPGEDLPTPWCLKSCKVYKKVLEKWQKFGLKLQKVQIEKWLRKGWNLSDAMRIVSLSMRKAHLWQKVVSIRVWNCHDQTNILLNNLRYLRLDIHDEL